MTDARLEIQRQLRRVAMRERALLIVGGGAAFTAVLAFGWVCGVMALNLGTRPPLGLAWLVLATAAVAAGWTAREVPAAGGLRRQALRAEAVRPVLAGELLTVLDRSSRPLGSEVLVERMALRVAGPLRAIPPRELVPTRTAGLPVLMAVLASVLLALSSVLPLGPASILTAYAPGASPPAPTLPVGGPRAVVGDITLRYLYPTYTGLSPMEVPNSNGDIHAPPGTTVEIRARAQVAWTSVRLEAAGVVSPAEIGADRGLRTSLTVAAGTPEDAIWRFQFDGPAGPMVSSDYRILVDPDLAPQVTVDVTAPRVSAAVDQSVGIPWRAHDDYGIARVVLEIREGGKTWEVPVRAPLNPTTDLDDRLALTPTEMKLRSGDTAQIRVKAWDNDAVSGAKAGWSAPIQLTVAGAGRDLARLRSARKDVRDALVLVLGDFLVDDQPAIKLPADGPGWAKGALARYDAYDTLVGTSWSGGEGVAADRAAMTQVDDTRRALFGLIRALPASDRLADADGAAIVAAQGAHIEALEGAILLFGQMIQVAALKDIERMAAEMAGDAEQMNKDFASLNAGNTPEALTRMDELQRMLEALSAAAAQLGDSSLGEFTNDSAQQLQGMLAEARKALREGRYDDAKALMDRVAEAMRQFADGLKDQQKRGEERSEALGNAMKDLKQKMSALQADQAKLQERTDQERQAHGASMDAAMAIWQEIEAHAQSAQSAATGVAAAAGPSGGGLSRDSRDLRAEADGLLDAARSKNAELARSRAEDVAQEANAFARLLVFMSRADGKAVPVAATTVPGIRADAEKVLALLDKLAQSQASPELQQALKKLAGDQQQLADRAQQIAEQAKSVAEQLPMKAPGLEKGTEQASAEGQRAAGAMRKGDPMSAAGGQQSAQDGLEEAQQALEQAEQAMAEMSQSEGQGEGQGGEAGKDGKPQNPNGGRDPNQNAPMMAIPAPEEFQTPEAYRKALMEGMQGNVPDQYHSSNLRYYEELVRQ